MISFNGTSSDDLGLYVENYPSRPVPKRKEQKWSVTGRNGDVLSTEDAWENVERSYEVYLSAETRGLARAADAVAAWLQTSTWSTLWDDYDDETYVMAHYSGPVDIASTLNRWGRCTIKFDCWPQRFLHSGSEEILLTSPGTVTNPTPFIAEPILTMYGSQGAGTLRVGTTATEADPTLEIADLGSVLDQAILDCREQEFYRNSVNLNRYISGTIPVLRPGINYISWAGVISGVGIVPRWWRL